MAPFYHKPYHFTERFKERFGRKLKERDFKQLINTILAGRYKEVGREDSRIVAELDYRGSRLRVVFDRLNHHLVTVMYISSHSAKKLYKTKFKGRKRAEMENI